MSTQCCRSVPFRAKTRGLGAHLVFARLKPWTLVHGSAPAQVQPSSCPPQFLLTHPFQPTLCCSAPTLLATPPFSVWSNLLQLSTMLDVGLERAQAVAARQPRLLALALSTLAARMDELEEALE